MAYPGTSTIPARHQDVAELVKMAYHTICGTIRIRQQIKRFFVTKCRTIEDSEFNWIEYHLRLKEQSQRLN